MQQVGPVGWGSADGGLVLANTKSCYSPRYSLCLVLAVSFPFDGCSELGQEVQRAFKDIKEIRTALAQVTERERQRDSMLMSVMNEVAEERRKRERLEKMFTDFEVMLAEERAMALDPDDAQLPDGT